ncbi:BspA family leucine-rich repeat surface protein [Kaistella antarctica]|uniref:Bacterial surface protein 26-residue repeat n=1 Tax=Kaistella antarctica TaxID=266748 RepID=A0A448NNF0_9FLAO|nr:BspA family leucine-rich repeat surface protein [Kaistella antarctica]KEY19797.1 hypothetical protein HY04_00785 [Kaistella antarctica]SEV97585.1 Por secretion system C-terminal sorting domain-containing protein [Kaistella antarctica]VEH96447.1 bacterial surface protein 26-residue repeat [Kaistella antarctica]
MKQLFINFKKKNQLDLKSSATRNHPKSKIGNSAKTCLLLFAFLFFSISISAQAELITEWKTDNFGTSANNQIRILAEGSYDYTWKRVGGVSTGSGSANGNTTINFPTPGNYEVKMKPTGATPLNLFTFGFGNGDPKKLLKITQWGTMKWSTFYAAFGATSNLKITATDVPDLRLVEDMFSMFAFSGVQDIPNINNWDVRNITDMSAAFKSSKFNGDISNWNVSKVKDMQEMFYENTHFNQDIGKWDVSKVIRMDNMFKSASAFSQNLGTWKITSLMYAKAMFSATMGCQNYSKTLAGWAANDANTPTNLNFANQDLPTYSSEVVKARNHLINSRGWTISGDSQSATACPIDFVTEWNTQGTNTIIIPAQGNYTYSWVDLNDASRKDNGYGVNSTTIDFGQAGIYQVRIFPVGQSGFSLYFRGSTSNNQKKLSKITQWGAATWATLSGAFSETTNLSITATDIPDFSKVTSMFGSFERSGISTVPNMNQWDVSNVTDMTLAFTYALNFNENISNWDVSKVTSMDRLFGRTIQFNQNLNNWNVSNVIGMNGMFYEATSFNGNISSWSTSNVTDMESMFLLAKAFNQNIGAWDTGKVTNMRQMFFGTENFNQDLSQWNTSKVTDMRNMFASATAFDQNLGSWDLSQLTDAETMFNITSGMGCINYSKTLKGWATNNKTPQNINLGADGRSYSAEVVSNRNHLINNKNWTITGDSLGTCVLATANEDFANLKLFPNPVSDFLTVNGLYGKETLSLYDMNGRLMQSSKANGKEVKLNLSLYAKGMYLLNISSDKGTTTKKIMKQ